MLTIAATLAFAVQSYARDLAAADKILVRAYPLPVGDRALDELWSALKA